MIESLDHVVLTVRDIERSRDFYGRVLGMEVREQENRPLALHFGSQKLHLHQAGNEFSPKAAAPTPRTREKAESVARRSLVMRRSFVGSLTSKTRRSFQSAT